MKHLFTYLLATAVLLILLFQGYLFSQMNKVAYVNNQVLFDGFKGQKELSDKLKVFRNANKVQLDSLESAITRNSKNEQEMRNSWAKYNELKAQIAFKEEEKSSMYSLQIWARLNEYSKSYADEQGYDFVFGANGNGAIMYANDAKNISMEVLEYANGKYEGE